MKQVSDMIPRLPQPHQALPLPALALRAVTSKDGKMVYASSDTLFKGAFFTRDALEVAEDILSIKSKLAGNILLSAAALSGVKDDPASEQEYGKFSHEYRNTVVDGKAIKGSTLDIFNRLSFRWGGNEERMIYYGASDTTPHFLRTLQLYCAKNGTRILDQPVTLLQNGDTVQLREIASRALDWIITKLDTSQSGLLEFQRRNPHSFLNHVWIDSDEFYVHENGQLANHNAPVSSIELQGLAYDALLAAADLGIGDKKAALARATKLQARTIELLWQPERQYFALGTDYDESGKVRVIATETANPAELLDTRFFDNLSEDDRQKYVTGIVKTIFSKDFLTSVGIRSRSLAAAHVIPFWDYHGSYASWPKETYDIAKGLHRQGFTALSTQLENRLLNIVLKTMQYSEFYYVDGHGRILRHAPTQPPTTSEIFVVDATNKPESIQAWTVSAIYAITTKRLNDSLKLRRKIANTGWQAVLERKIMAQIPSINRVLNPFTLAMQYPTYKYQLSGRTNGSE